MTPIIPHTQAHPPLPCSPFGLALDPREIGDSPLGTVLRATPLAEVDRAIADRHPGPDDTVLPVTWQRSAEASGPAPATVEDLNIGERDKLRDTITGELARRGEAGAA
jgi:hypothetical protein